jgi:hypothetical protein
MKRTITITLTLFVCLVSFSQNTIFSSGFEGPGFDPGWTTGMTTNINQTPYDYPAGLDPWDMWDLTQEPLYVHSGYSAAYIGGTLNLENKYDWLMSPQFTVPTNARTSVNYWMWYHSSTPSNWTWLYIMVYDVAEDTWEMGELILYEMNAPFHYIEEYAFDLTPWIGKDVKVAFAKRGTYQFAMDDISFTFIDDGNDLGVGAILAPDNQYGCTLTSDEEIKIRIENTGTLDVSTFDVTYIINNATLVTETVNEEIKAGETLDYTFTEKADLSAFGDYTIDVEVIVEDDQDPGNNLRTTHVKSKDAEITIELLTDFYENETSWRIVDENNTIIATNGALQKTSLHTDHVCVMSTGCYTFTIYDTYGDGISFGPTPGYLNVYYNGEIIGGFSQDESNFGFEFKIDSIGDGCSGVNINSPYRETVKAYPNPVSSTLFLENLVEVTSVKIIDMLGREHTLQAEITGNKVAVDFSKFVNGLYLVKVISKDNNYDSFLIQKR